MSTAHDVAEEQFSAFFSTRFHQARRLAFLLCGDWHRADDLAQTAFVRVASSWHRIRDPNAVDAYLRTCLLRSFFTDQRRAWRRREASTANPPDRQAEVDSAEQVTTRVAVIRALAEVPPRQRAVLVCRYYDGLDVATTARVLGCTEGTVKSQAARGLAALRAALGELPEVAVRRAPPVARAPGGALAAVARLATGVAATASDVGTAARRGREAAASGVRRYAGGAELVASQPGRHDGGRKEHGR